MPGGPDFHDRYRRAVADGQLRRNLLAFQRGWRQSRAERFAEYAGQAGRSGDQEFQALRTRLKAAKDAVISDLPATFARFKAAAEANGAIVFEATSGEDAAAYVLALCRRTGSSILVKTKSMVSEEIRLNHYLEEGGVRAVETDLGEWIVQLRHETPSHMVMPAIHLSRAQVGETFSLATGHAVSRDDVSQQVGLARTELRKDFLAARVGMTGANALIAETGTTMIITNEGNEGMVTTLPQVQVVLVGYEKLLPTFEDAMTQLRLLPRSATGQAITTYVTFLTGPDRPERELHYVFVDNGRSAMREDPDFVDALRCIRCAACASVCPPYQVVGGHVFGHIYSGAIGLVNTPFHHTLADAAGPQSLCVSCNACQTVCPVDIPLPQQILAVRRRVVEADGLSRATRLALAVWARPALFRGLARTAGVLARPFARDGLLPVPMPGRHAWRTPPAPAVRPARSRLPESIAAGTKSPQLSQVLKGTTVAYFLQCLTDSIVPEQAEAAVKLLRACGVRIVIPRGQHCCGLPFLDAGDTKGARRLARQTLGVFETVSADYVVSAANSCVAAIVHEYPHLFRDEPEWKARAQRLAGRMQDLATFLTQTAQVDAAAVQRSAPAITYQPFCQSANVLHADQAGRRLLTDVGGLELRDLDEAHVCCGFGGSTSFSAPEVARGIVERKLENVDRTGARILVTDNPGCVMHLRGAAHASGRRDLRVLHLAEVVAEAVLGGRESMTARS
ncbi:MAG TPA: LUD domain-containing protein [Candidatus Limnocylindrales bacterium]|nr:LUD domain-containing protein [Candidatus Limnocylindrales bacterium]